MINRALGRGNKDVAEKFWRRRRRWQILEKCQFQRGCQDAGWGNSEAAPGEITAAGRAMAETGTKVSTEQGGIGQMMEHWQTSVRECFGHVSLPWVLTGFSLRLPGKLGEAAWMLLGENRGDDGQLKYNEENGWEDDDFTQTSTRLGGERHR
eukprot:6057373-Amphidinium_carterae.6